MRQAYEQSNAFRLLAWVLNYLLQTQKFLYVYHVFRVTPATFWGTFGINTIYATSFHSNLCDAHQT